MQGFPPNTRNYMVKSTYGLVKRKCTTFCQYYNNIITFLCSTLLLAPTVFQPNETKFSISFCSNSYPPTKPMYTPLPLAGLSPTPAIINIRYSVNYEHFTLIATWK